VQVKHTLLSMQHFPFDALCTVQRNITDNSSDNVAALITLTGTFFWKKSIHQQIPYYMLIDMTKKLMQYRNKSLALLQYAY
jgi:hypothetical protein